MGFCLAVWETVQVNILYYTLASLGLWWCQKSLLCKLHLHVNEQILYWYASCKGQWVHCHSLGILVEQSLFELRVTRMSDMPICQQRNPHNINLTFNYWSTLQQRLIKHEVNTVTPLVWILSPSVFCNWQPSRPKTHSSAADWLIMKIICSEGVDKLAIFRII